VVAAEDPRVNAAAPTSVISQSYSYQATHDYVNARRQELPRRPDVAESLRHYVQPDPLSSGSSLGKPADVQGLSGAPRAPLACSYAGTDHPARVVDHQGGNMRCETCSQPAMFVCSACRKAPYCSVSCQVCFRCFVPVLVTSGGSNRQFGTALPSFGPHLTFTHRDRVDLISVL